MANPKVDATGKAQIGGGSDDGGPGRASHVPGFLPDGTIVNNNYLVGLV